MKSDPKDCLYCQNNETLHNLMIEIAQLSVSRVFLFKEQTYRGRCLVAYKDHVNDLNELTDEERNAFMADVARVTRAMQKAFNPEKINYGAYSDKLSHLHFHLAPKYVDGPDYGGTFQMNPGKVYLTDVEYQELVEDRIEIIGDKGMICFSVFTYDPIALHTERGREEIPVENPIYVQQPLIQAVVDHLLGKSICNCDGESATLTNWVMDKILNKI